MTSLRIGVLYNCQSEGIAIALRALLPAAQVLHFTIAGMPRNLAAWQAAATELDSCDHVVSCLVTKEFGPLATQSMRRTARNFHRLPAIRFRGFHPDMVYLRQAGKFVTGPTGDYHSRIAVAGFLGGLGATETAALYNRLAFRRLGYLDGFAAQCALLQEDLASFDIDGPTLLRIWLAAGCFMHSLNHPKMTVLLSIARAACAAMGVTPENAEVSASALPDRLARMAIHPVFPEIAAAAGVAPEGMFRGGLAPDGSSRELSAEAFVTACFAEYAKVPREVLLAGEQVEEAVGALGLKE